MEGGVDSAHPESRFLSPIDNLRPYRSLWNRAVHEQTVTLKSNQQQTVTIAFEGSIKYG